MLLQSSKLFRRSFYMHVRDAPGLLCYTKKLPSTEDQRLWADAIVGFSCEMPKITDTDSPRSAQSNPKPSAKCGKFDESLHTSSQTTKTTV